MLLNETTFVKFMNIFNYLLYFHGNQVHISGARSIDAANPNISKPPEYFHTVCHIEILCSFISLWNILTLVNVKNK